MALLYFAEIERPADRRAAREAEHCAGRWLLCKVLGCEASKVRLRADGKPYLPDGPWFSISHCEGYGARAGYSLILLAVSELGEIGCDAEHSERPLRNAKALRRKIAQPGEETVPLLQLWVTKEAIYKADGTGTISITMLNKYLVAVCCCAQESLELPAIAMTL